MNRTEILKPGKNVKLIEMPDGKLAPIHVLTLGNTYTIRRWDGSNVVITSDEPGTEVSIWHGRVQLV